MYQRMVQHITKLNPDHEVHTFGSGEACLRQLTLKPDIVSLDLSLPDMPGEEVFRKIRSFDPDISVIIVSGQQDVNVAVKLLREGAFDYLTKDNETKDRLLHALPIFHVHGLFVAMHCAFLSGAPMVWLEKFTEAGVIAGLARSTVLMGVPTFYTRLLEASGFTMASAANIRLFICGSAPLLESTFHAFEERTGQRRARLAAVKA